MKRYNYPLCENEINSLFYDFKFDYDLKEKADKFAFRLKPNEKDQEDFLYALKSISDAKLTIAIKSYDSLDTYMRDMIIEFLNEYIQEDDITEDNIELYDNWFLINHNYKNAHDYCEYKVVGNYNNNLVLANMNNFGEVLMYSENEMNELINNNNLEVIY